MADRLVYRVRVLPDQVLTAERRLRDLYREAASYRMHDIIKYPDLINKAWDREVELAKLERRPRK
jgi:hypothetical protein